MNVESFKQLAKTFSIYQYRQLLADTLTPVSLLNIREGAIILSFLNLLKGAISWLDILFWVVIHMKFAV